MEVVERKVSKRSIYTASTVLQWTYLYGIVIYFMIFDYSYRYYTFLNRNMNRARSPNSAISVPVVVRVRERERERERKNAPQPFYHLDYLTLTKEFIDMMALRRV